MTKEEQEINRSMKQLLPHHIATKLNIITQYTTVEELRKIYYELIEFAQTKFKAPLSATNMYYLRRQIINGICKTEASWTGLVAALALEDITVRDMPNFNEQRTNVPAPPAHAYRATFGIKMPYIGGGSVVFSVTSASSSSGSASSSGSY